MFGWLVLITCCCYIMHMGWRLSSLTWDRFRNDRSHTERGFYFLNPKTKYRKKKKTKNCKNTSTDNNWKQLQLPVIRPLGRHHVSYDYGHFMHLDALSSQSPVIAGFGSRSTATLKLHTWVKVGWMDDSFRQPCYLSIRLCSINKQHVPSFL